MLSSRGGSLLQRQQVWTAVSYSLGISHEEKEEEWDDVHHGLNIIFYSWLLLMSLSSNVAVQHCLPFDSFVALPSLFSFFLFLLLFAFGLGFVFRCTSLSLLNVWF